MNMKEIQQELLTQDSWGTSHPYWVIRDYLEVVTPENVGRVEEYKYYNSDVCDCCTEEQLKEQLTSDEIEFTEDNFEEVAEENGYEKYWFALQPEDHEVFLTHKGAEEYFKARRHAFSHRAHLYCKSAYYSYELQLVQETIKKGLFTEEQEKD